ncbi:MAG TPA: methyltransferase domain-containing protein [Steroidobacteraceae bacterium]|nr:methyltransferase domain-containing protein [Steroidobacteraceae bacterium]
MDARLQRRIQRYGWDLAASDYEPLWKAQLAEAQKAVLRAASPARGERVLDLACGTGLVALQAARAVGPHGRVLGIDLSARMIAAARAHALEQAVPNAEFSRMDAEKLDLPARTFDVALCALGFMYLPDPERALLEMRRVLRPGGRIALAVWGERERCGWSGVFPIAAAEVASDVCPLFFQLGQGSALAELCGRLQFDTIHHSRIQATLSYADAATACDAALVGGPVALAWSRFSEEVRDRVRARYLQSIEPWKCGAGYRVPAEFVVVSGVVPQPGGLRIAAGGFSV